VRGVNLKGLAGLVLVAATVVGCGSGGDAKAPPAVKVNGRSVADYKACIAPRNSAVDAWNRLTQQRDAAGAAQVVVNGVTFETYTDWAKANGKPVTQPKC
jgi:hypothetical protein